VLHRPIESTAVTGQVKVLASCASRFEESVFSRITFEPNWWTIASDTRACEPVDQSMGAAEMSHLQPRDWEHLIDRAETEPDLQKVREYLKDVETAVVLHGIDRFKTPNGHVDATDLRRISDRLLKGHGLDCVLSNSELSVCNIELR
jgi:hypothetical protein